MILPIESRGMPTRVFPTLQPPVNDAAIPNTNPPLKIHQLKDLLDFAFRGH